MVDSRQGAPQLSANGYEFPVKFGSFTEYDGFEFVRKGCIGIDAHLVILSGPKHWSFWARFGMFFAITIPPLVIGIIIGPVLAWLILHYWCASPGTVSFSRDVIQEVTRKKRLLTFKAPAENGTKLRKSVFLANSEIEAIEIEHALTTRPVVPRTPVG